MNHRFRSKTVIITGASAGIGAAAAQRFAREGANLVLAARGQPALDRLVDQLGASCEAIAVPTDVSDPHACDALLARAQDAFGHIDVLVNNAGFNRRGRVEHLPADQLAHIADVNLRGPIVLCRQVLPYLRRAGGGAIVNVASIAGRIPLHGEAVYSATKFALRAFTIALAQELRGSGVTASLVSPGPVDTGFIMDELDSVPDVVFSQRMSTADEIAALIVDCAADGKVERTHPRVAGYLATLAYLAPALRRVIEPVMERRGRKIKQQYRNRQAR